MESYERVRFDGVTVYLRNPTVTTLLGTRVLTGIEVNPDGDEMGSGQADEIRHIISLDLVSRRTPVVLDPKYARLVDL